jgi:glutathione S-transferase
MTVPLPLKLKGAPGSPYTRKMLALLRYRHLPYEFLIGDQATELGLPEPKVVLLPTFYLPDDTGEVRAEVDSTPLIRRFEAEFQGRSVIPADPVLAYLNNLLEDYADEWLTKAMFHYRWRFAADIDKAGTVLPLWRDISAAPEKLAAAKRFVSERQIARLHVVGSNDTTAPVIEASYHRFLAVFDALLQHQPFLFGRRPASADFAIYAQLTQLARFDPTPAGICLREAPRVGAWTDLVDDLSGTPAPQDGWLRTGAGALPPGAVGVLRDLLSEVGRCYVPVMLANAEALRRGDAQVSTTVEGQPWRQAPFAYQGKCLQWLRESFAGLGEAHRREVVALLAGTGCEPLLEATR